MQEIVYYHKNNLNLKKLITFINMKYLVTNTEGVKTFKTAIYNKQNSGLELL